MAGMRAGLGALVMALMLSACGKAPEAMGCMDEQVQKHAQTALLTQILRWQEPDGGPDALPAVRIERSLKEDLGKLLSRRRRSSTSDPVQLADIRQLRGPDSAWNATSSPEDERLFPFSVPHKAGESTLYRCAAWATVSRAGARAATLPTGFNEVLRYPGSGVQFPIVYETRTTPEGDVWVVGGVTHPMADFVLRNMFGRPVSLEMHPLSGNDDQDDDDEAEDADDGDEDEDGEASDE